MDTRSSRGDQRKVVINRSRVARGKEVGFIGYSSGVRLPRTQKAHPSKQSLLGTPRVGLGLGFGLGWGGEWLQAGASTVGKGGLVVSSGRGPRVVCEGCAELARIVAWLALYELALGLGLGLRLASGRGFGLGV